MGINPQRLILTPLNLGGNKAPTSYTAALTAATLQSISSVAPNPSQNPLGMTVNQQNTVWLLRAATDFSEIYDQLTAPVTSLTIMHNLITDLTTISNYADPQLQTLIQNTLKAYQQSGDSAFISAWTGSLGHSLFGLLSPATNNVYDFSNLSLSEQMSIYNLMLHGLKITGGAAGSDTTAIEQIVQNFWGGGQGSGSTLAAHFTQVLSLYYYTNNLNADGTLNTTGFVNSMINYFKNINDICNAAGYSPQPFSLTSPEFEQGDPIFSSSVDTSGLPSFLTPLFNGVTITAGDVTAQVGAGLNTIFSLINPTTNNSNSSISFFDTSAYFNALKIPLNSLPTSNNDTLPLDAMNNPLTGSTPPTLNNPLLDRFSAFLTLHVWPTLYTPLTSNPTSTLQPLTTAQQNTFWAIRATKDFALLYNQLKQSSPNSTITANLLTDLNTIANYAPTSMKASIQLGLSTYNLSPSTFMTNWEGSLGLTFYTTLTDSSSTYDFSNLTLSEQMDIYQCMLSGLQIQLPKYTFSGPTYSLSQIISTFWGGNIASNGGYVGSAFAAHFFQTASLYYYSQSLNEDGSFNQSAFTTSITNLFSQLNTIFKTAGFNDYAPNSLDPSYKIPGPPTFPTVGSGAPLNIPGSGGYSFNSPDFPDFLLPLFNGISSPAGGSGCDLSTAFHAFNPSTFNAETFFSSTLNINALPTEANVSPLPPDATTNPLQSTEAKPTLYFPLLDSFTASMNPAIWQYLKNV